MTFNHNSGDKNPTAAKATRSKTAANNKAGKKAARKKAASIKTAATTTAKVAAKKSSSRAKQKSACARREDAATQLPPGDGEGQDPFEIAKQTMKGSVPAIVETMVKLAKQGSCSHAKTLLEMTGAKHMFGAEAESQDSGEPWAKLVLQRMEQAEQEEQMER